MGNLSSQQFKSVVVYLEFDSYLQTLTGVSKTSIEVTEGTPFFMLLQAILDSYPAILKQDLTSLGFSVNGLKPSPQATLTAHDVVYLGLENELSEKKQKQYYN